MQNPNPNPNPNHINSTDLIVGTRIITILKFFLGTEAFPTLL